jgi:hypothetical protein
MGDVYYENHTERCVYVVHLKEVKCKVICESQDDLCTPPQVQHVHVRTQCGKCAEVQCPKAAMVTRRRKGPNQTERVDQEEVECYTWSVR